KIKKKIKKNILCQFFFDNKKKHQGITITIYHQMKAQFVLKKQGIIHLDVQSSCDDMYDFTNTCQRCKILFSL
ncbi:unnamed protein product, partial [Staurois parvus]